MERAAEQLIAKDFVPWGILHSVHDPEGHEALQTIGHEPWSLSIIALYPLCVRIYVFLVLSAIFISGLPNLPKLQQVWKAAFLQPILTLRPELPQGVLRPVHARLMSP
jgi:hypothetical protein